MKKRIHVIAIIVSVCALSAILGFFWHAYLAPVSKKAALPPPTVVSSTPPYHKIVDVILPAIHPTISWGTATVTAESPKVFAYAHGTVVADGKIFIGMASAGGNTFPTNELVIFNDPSDLSHPTLIRLRDLGDIETIVYDSLNDRVYFELSNNKALKLYMLNPHTDAVIALVSTTSIDAGPRPAITTDGTYIYGITNTDPSTVFKVKIFGGQIASSSAGHIANGHSAAIGIYGSSTELYFGGDMTNGFEKADAATLAPISSLTIAPCGMSDDMPYMQTSAIGGYVYIGCEGVPYGIRVRTSDMSFDRFSLPGASLGLFIFGSDLYNAAQDGRIDVFPSLDLGNLRRYKVTPDGSTKPFATNGQDLELNEVMYLPQIDKLYVTAWFGIQGLYQISTNTI